MRRFSHLDPRGRAKMVDVTTKPESAREAIARGHIACQRATIRLILNDALPKGDVLAAARVAGILAAKRVDQLIPLCHPLLITSAEVTFATREDASRIDIESRVKTTAKTGAEMEALAAVSVAALTIYDMCKAVDKDMVIGNVRLVAKRGGKSGEYRRPGEA